MIRPPLTLALRHRLSVAQRETLVMFCDTVPLWR